MITFRCLGPLHTLFEELFKVEGWVGRGHVGPIPGREFHTGSSLKGFRVDMCRYNVVLTSNLHECRHHIWVLRSGEMGVKAKNAGEGRRHRCRVWIEVESIQYIRWLEYSWASVHSKRKHENRKEAQSAQCIPGLEYSWASMRFGFLQTRAQKEDNV